MWALQIDGAYGVLGDADARVIGGHLFTRDPGTYLLGAYTSFHEWNGIKIFRAAVETELYMNRFSFTALVTVGDGGTILVKNQ